MSSVTFKEMYPSRRLIFMNYLSMPLNQNLGDVSRELLVGRVSRKDIVFVMYNS